MNRSCYGLNKVLDIKPHVPLIMRIVRPINIQESIKIGPRWGLNLPPYDRGAAASPTRPSGSITRCIQISGVRNADPNCLFVYYFSQILF